MFLTDFRPKKENYQLNFSRKEQPRFLEQIQGKYNPENGKAST